VGNTRKKLLTVGVNAILLEVIWQGPKKEFVEDTTLVDDQIMLHLLKSLAGQILWTVIEVVESVTSNQRNGVG